MKNVLLTLPMAMKVRVEPSWNVTVVDPDGRFTATFTPDSSADAITQRLRKLIS